MKIPIAVAAHYPARAFWHTRIMVEDLRRAALDRLLDDTSPTGWSSGHPYRKWQGAHWRLISLVELGEVDHPEMVSMLDRVLDWLTGAGHLKGIEPIDGRHRLCASQEGNALFVASRMDKAHAAKSLADNLVAWQWLDGGWNCDRRVEVVHASFHESVWPMRGLVAYYDATGDRTALEAAHRTGRFLLRHRLFRSERSGEVIDSAWLDIHWPPYWHYDVLQGLRAVATAGLLGDEDAGEALAWLRSRRRDDGTWRTSGRRWWKRPGANGGGVDVVDWTALTPQIVTAQASEVLAAAS